MAAAFPAGPGQATTTSFWWWCHFLKVAEGAENEAAQRMFGFRWDVEHYCRTSLVLMMDLVLILRFSDRLWTFWIWCSADSPAVLHVGGFVHADGQFDLQLRVLAVLGDDHAVELGLLRPVCGWIQNHLRRGGRRAQRRAGIGQQVS